MRASTLDSGPGRRWSTARVPEAEQFALWREVASAAFVSVSLTRAGDGPFPSSVSARAVGPLAVSHIVSPAQSVTRTAAHVRREAGDVYFLNLPLTGGSLASQDGRTARLEKGDFAIVDSSRPFDLDFRQAFGQISVRLPHDLLSPLLAAPWDATAVRVRGDQGVGAVAAGAIRALAAMEGSVDRHAARSLAEQVAALVALALGASQAPVASRGRALLLQAALDEVERSLGDPDLSPSLVAARVGISTRYLHDLFRDRGRSFGRTVLVRRLERCHRDLSDPSRIHCPVAEIAGRHGFGDPSYMARAFRAHYGVSPRALRAG